jgi:hypothetical protein
LGNWHERGIRRKKARFPARANFRAETLEEWGNRAFVMSTSVQRVGEVRRLKIENTEKAAINNVNYYTRFICYARRAASLVFDSY